MDTETIKTRQQQAWATGDFSMVAPYIYIVGELLCEAADLRAGQKVLDVATGSGNTALAAARRCCEVTGIDFVPALLERARERVAAERLRATFVPGDAEHIPFPDASFDAVLSTFGAMFAPDQERAARELLRVCRSGGTIAMANWTPEGFAGRMFRVTGQHVPPPPGLAPPVLWGTEARLRELFGGEVRSLSITKRTCFFRWLSVEQWLDFMRRYFGPMQRAFAALDPPGQEKLARDLVDLARAMSRPGEPTMVLPSEYLEVVAIRR
jgi:SAM-dependent methyltransferase